MLLWSGVTETMKKLNLLFNYYRDEEVTFISIEIICSSCIQLEWSESYKVPTIRAKNAVKLVDKHAQNINPPFWPLPPIWFESAKYGNCILICPSCWLAKKKKRIDTSTSENDSFIVSGFHPYVREELVKLLFSHVEISILKEKKIQIVNLEAPNIVNDNIGLVHFYWICTLFFRINIGTRMIEMLHFWTFELKTMLHGLGIPRRIYTSVWHWTRLFLEYFILFRTILECPVPTFGHESSQKMKSPCHTQRIEFSVLVLYLELRLGSCVCWFYELGFPLLHFLHNSI